MNVRLKTLREARLALEPGIQAGCACQRCGTEIATMIGVITADTPELVAEVSAALGEPCQRLTLWMFQGCDECARPDSARQKLFADWVQMLEDERSGGAAALQ